MTEERLERMLLRPSAITIHDESEVHNFSLLVSNRFQITLEENTRSNIINCITDVSGADLPE